MPGSKHHAVVGFAHKCFANAHSVGFNGNVVIPKLAFHHRPPAIFPPENPHRFRRQCVDVRVQVHGNAPAAVRCPFFGQRPVRLLQFRGRPGGQHNDHVRCTKNSR